MEDDDKGPSVLYSECEKALEELKNKKATGPEGIPAELLKASGSAGKRELFKISNEIYIRGEWPEDFLESMIILLKRRVERKNVLISERSVSSRMRQKLC